jgi:hypothetical protein
VERDICVKLEEATMTTRTASQEIIDEVTSWPGVSTAPGRFGALALVHEGRELGHLHGDRSAHFSFPKSLWRELREQRRIERHPIFPDREGPAARPIANEDDVRDVIALMRLNYERATAPAEGRAPDAA